MKEVNCGVCTYPTTRPGGAPSRKFSVRSVLSLSRDNSLHSGLRFGVHLEEGVAPWLRAGALRRRGVLQVTQILLIDDDRELCAMLAAKVKKLGDTEVIIKAGKEHRFVVVFRGKGLEGPLTDADPNREGFAIPSVKARDEKNAKQKKMAKLIAEFYAAALPVIAKERPANGFLMRGIAHQPHIPLFADRYLLRPACLAVYPMYKGLAQLVGMQKIEGPQTIQEQFQRYVAEYDNFDFFFIHFKYTDKYGEDGNFAAKKKAIEDFDAALPILLGKKPDVIAITGDHSTPCPMKGHSWHPQPVLIHSACSGSDKLERFTETGANSGSLGVFEAKYLMRLMQANARKFDKFGA